MLVTSIVWLIFVFLHLIFVKITVYSYWTEFLTNLQKCPKKANKRLEKVLKIFGELKRVESLWRLDKKDHYRFVWFYWFARC